MKMDMQNAFKYNKIAITKRCISTNIRYVGEYQLKFKQSTEESNNLINVCPKGDSESREYAIWGMPTGADDI